MILVKYSEEKYLQQLVEGCIRFSPISSYRQVEEDAYYIGMADKYDGMARMTADNLTIIDEGKERNYQGKIVLNVDLEGMERVGVFCLSQYDDYTDMMKHYEKMFAAFPNSTHALIIHTPDIFIRDIQDAVYMVGGGVVTYGNCKDPQLEEKNMWKQALFKRREYEYQKEFRFILTDNPIQRPRFFRYDNHSKMTLLEKGELESWV